VSENAQIVAVLKDNGSAYDVEVSSYNSTTGVLSPPDTYEVTDEVDWGVSKLVFSPDGNYIAFNGGYDKDYVTIINTNNGDVTTITTPDNEGTYSPVFYEHGGTLFLAVGGGYQNGSIELIDVDALQLETTIPVFPNYNYALDFDPSEEYVVTGGYNGIIKIFSVNGTDYDEVAMIPALNVNRLQFTQDNLYVVSGQGPSPASLVIYRIVRGPSSVSGSNPRLYKMYPNPTEGILYLEGLDDTWMTVHTVCGQRVMEAQVRFSQIDVSGLEVGLYVLRAVKDDVAYAIKFVKE
jgi:WD40 repeat protein